LFERKRVVDLPALLKALQTPSAVSVYRRLGELGYRSSYTHAGRYYTLRDLPAFDANGLWHHEGVGFSRAGTLKETVVGLVEAARAGQFHRELQERLRVRVYNTLLDLTTHRRVGRETVAGEYLYVSAEAQRAAAQVAQRKTQLSILAPRPPPAVEQAQTVEVLLDVIRHPGDEPVAVAKRLRARGLHVSQEQVEEIFARYALQKKTARSRSRRWPRSGRPQRR
jgi:hypothetical protein